MARRIADGILAVGAEPFLDEVEIEAGEDFDDKILSFLERADELLVLLTPWALNRPYVWAELGAAWGRRIPIVGVLHGMTPTELQKRDGVPVFLKKRNLIDINSIDTYFQQVRRRVKQRRRIRGKR
ncbi:MAG: toll/interleukin-1 receptor domain-containing protein [Ignavibacteriae bacterium]|nr:toll/interleukin-1 receptor domain-containing protein [Ignavibacteriota bacterium]